MELFKKLTTVRTNLQKDLQVKHVFYHYDVAPPMNLPMADGYRSDIHIATEFWVDRSEPKAMETQLRISKSMIIQHLYGEVLNQLLPIKRAIANGDRQHAIDLVETLERNILEG